jgi:asparagine synthase (glutamine-hydrolyzing)
VCGICGVYEYGKNTEVSESLVVNMRDTLFHRGPNDAGVFVSDDKSIGLGHRRLSIVDLSESGRQPMVNASGDLWIAFNGEIYNHQKLRKDLEAKGYIYHSQSDTETLLYLFEEYGEACLPMLEGMFAFAVWNAKTRKLFVARDRLGIKPLYFYDEGGRFVFGSEPKALLAHPSITAEVDEAALYHFVSFICLPAPHTLFKDIHKLEPATFMVVGDNGIERKQRWWEPYGEGKEKILSEEEYIQTIRELLTEATDKRMMSDVPFGAFLSGGIDSSLNTALMSQLLDRPVDTFTVGFSTAGTERFNEFSEARFVADAFSTHHQEIHIDTQKVLDELPGFFEQQDDPVAHPVCIPFYMMSKGAKEKGVTVVQVGEGSDEIFIGYERFMSELKTHDGWKWRWFTRMPRIVKQLFYRLEKYQYERKSTGDAPYFRAQQEYNRRMASEEEIFWGGLVCFSEDFKPKMFSEEFLTRNKGLNTYKDILAPVYDKLKRDLPGGDQPQYMSYVEMGLRLPEHLLMRVDKMSMASAMEARVPFLDHKLVELVFNMPREMKINGGAKSILKKAARGIIPDEIIDRRKQGFAAPASDWFKEMPAEFERALLHSPITDSGIFSQSFLEDMVRRVKENSGWELHVWSIFVIARWYERWIAGVKQPDTVA